MPCPRLFCRLLLFETFAAPLWGMILFLHSSALGFGQVICFGQWDMSRHGVCHFQAGILRAIMWSCHVLCLFLCNKHAMGRNCSLSLGSRSKTKQGTASANSQLWKWEINLHCSHLPLGVTCYCSIRQPTLTDTVTQQRNNRADLSPNSHSEVSFYPTYHTEQNVWLMV